MKYLTILCQSRYHKRPVESEGNYHDLLIDGEEWRIWFCEPCCNRVVGGRIGNFMYLLEDALGIRCEHDRYVGIRQILPTQTIENFEAQWKQFYRGRKTRRIWKESGIEILERVRSSYASISVEAHEIHDSLKPVYSSSYTRYWNSAEIEGGRKLIQAKVNALVRQFPSIRKAETERIQWKKNQKLLRNCKKLLKRGRVA